MDFQAGDGKLINVATGGGEHARDTIKYAFLSGVKKIGRNEYGQSILWIKFLYFSIA